MFLEPEEGEFVYDGAHGLYDLEHFFETASHAGLNVIARPGPFCGAELKHGGLPDWLFKSYPQIRAQNCDGGEIRKDAVSYNHPVYLEKVRRWIQFISPVLAKFCVRRGGPISVVQLDNELMGVHLWNGSLDYNRESMGIDSDNGSYPQFLKVRYGSLDAVNAAYQMSAKSFSEIQPVPGCKHHFPGDAETA
jgi:beta-galactosidase